MVPPAVWRCVEVDAIEEELPAEEAVLCPEEQHEEEWPEVRA